MHTGIRAKRSIFNRLPLKETLSSRKNMSSAVHVITAEAVKRPFRWTSACFYEWRHWCEFLKLTFQMKVARQVALHRLKSPARSKQEKGWKAASLKTLAAIKVGTYNWKRFSKNNFWCSTPRFIFNLTMNTVTASWNCKEQTAFILLCLTKKTWKEEHKLRRGLMENLVFN